MGRRTTHTHTGKQKYGDLIGDPEPVPSAWRSQGLEKRLREAHAEASASTSEERLLPASHSQD